MAEQKLIVTEEVAEVGAQALKLHWFYNISIVWFAATVYKIIGMFVLFSCHIEPRLARLLESRLSYLEFTK